ncbi:MAG: hypothetical protein WCS96_10055 [Victivallales bacterium]|jgi:hypothetical protein
MQIKRDDIIFMDTNVIIEAERAGILKHLAGHYENLTTVEKCVEELNTGNKTAPDYVPVDTEFVKGSMSVKQVSQKETIELLLKLNNEVTVHDGEKELLAHINGQNVKIFYICSPDRACIIAAGKLGLIDKVISLENLTESCGIKNSKLRNHFSKKWLQDFKTKLALESI